MLLTIASELSLIYKCKIKIIPYVLTWVGVATMYHKKYNGLDVRFDGVGTLK